MTIDVIIMLLFQTRITSAARARRQILQNPSGTALNVSPAQKVWAANTSTVRSASLSVLVTNRSQTVTRYAGLAWTVTQINRSGRTMTVSRAQTTSTSETLAATTTVQKAT